MRPQSEGVGAEASPRLVVKPRSNQPQERFILSCDRISHLIPVDPAGGHCYRGPTKPCESRGSLRGAPAHGSVTRG